MKVVDKTVSKPLRAAALALMLYDTLRYTLVYPLPLKITLLTDLTVDLRETQGPTAENALAGFSSSRVNHPCFHFDIVL